MDNPRPNTTALNDQQPAPPRQQESNYATSKMQQFYSTVNTVAKRNKFYWILL